MTRLSLKWEVPDDKGAVLIFDKAAWALFEANAGASGIDAEEMISVAVVELMGTISRYRLKD